MAQAEHRKESAKTKARTQGHTVTSDSLGQSHRAEPRPRAREVSRKRQDRVWLRMEKCYSRSFLQLLTSYAKGEASQESPALMC